MRLLSLALFLAACACGGSPAPAADAPAAAASEGIVPPPFPADELRAGLPAGTEMKFRVEAAGQPTVIQHWTFTAADDSGCTIHARILAEDGTLVSDEGEGTSSWQELESHAHFPAARTTRSESSVEVAAGTYDTWLFEVQPEEPGGPIKKFHFAKELPGPPVLMEVVQDGTVAMKMELLSRSVKRPRAGGGR